MTASSSIAAWARRAAPVVALLPLLADCGPKRNEFAPPCPGRAFLADAANIDLYRQTDLPSGRHDITDLVLHGRVVGLNGSCKPGNSAGTLLTTVVMSVELTRGPAMAGREAEVPVFLAITEGDQVLDKRIYRLHVTFPANVDRLLVNSDEQSMLLPVSATKSGAAYGIMVGFQLTREQLELNRTNAR